MSPARVKASAAEVDDLLAKVGHPRTAELQAVRRIILGADRRISEGIKWNAPSFRTSEWFATFHLRAKEGVQVILHLGAKKRPGVEAPEVDDPAGLLEWLGADRATVRFRDAADVRAKREAFAGVVRRWIEHV